MSIALQVVVLDVSGDTSDRRAYKIQRNEYTNKYDVSISLSAGEKTTVNVPFDKVELIYIEAESEVKVYQNLETNYWQVDSLFVASDASLTDLELESTADQVVQLFLGGE